MAQSRSRAYRLWLALALICSATITGIGLRPADAEVTAVSGSACGYFTKVGLFGGPQMVRGCGQGADAPATNASPSVTLPTTGSATPITATDADGALAEYGPAKIFSGQYPNQANDPGQAATSPPSGPLMVSTQGTTGANGSVTSFAEVTQGTQGTADPNQPRGVGPGPVVADAVRSTCTAAESGVTASTTITNGTLVLSTDPDGAALTSEPVPVNPPANYTRTGRIDNVGDNYRVVYNEQTTANGAITVNAVHLFLLGPTAVGELVIAQSTCGVTASAAPGTTTTTGQGATTTTQPGATTSTSQTGATSTTQPGATTSTSQTGATSTTTQAGAGTTTTRAVATTTTQAGGATTTTAGSGTTPTTAAGGGTASAVSGGACGYFTRVGLFGGPQMLRGCGQGADAPASNASPSVTLPVAGSANPITATDADGAVAEYGPAKIFSGQYPADPNAAAPPSGPLTVSTQGTTSGSVTSSASVTMPRGVGPGPIVADGVSSTCTAAQSGNTASTTITNGTLITSTTPDGSAGASEPVPANPSANYTRTGRIDNVGDNFRVVYNEQTTNANGSITVNAVHLYLLGPTAVGELVIAQSTCGRGAAGTGGGGTGTGGTGAGATATGGGTAAAAGNRVASTGTNATGLVALALLLLAAGAHAKHCAPQIQWGSAGDSGRRIAWPQASRRSTTRLRKRPWD